jgi:predicted nicotinamide N-methyase
MDGEIQWTDDSIRWDGGLRVKTNDKCLDNEEKGSSYSSDDEDYILDPFKDANPFELFSFHFEKMSPPVIIDDESSNNVMVEDDARFVNIQIRGYKTDADEVWQSTGLTLWRASDYLARYQMDNLHLFHNKRILELGAGLGLNGILAWRSTVSSVVSSSDNTHVCITDGDSDALVHLRENVKRNIKVDDGNGIINKVSCHQLIWGQDSSETFLSQVANKQKFDVIIASDIIYSTVIVEPLWETIKTLLKEKDGVFIMAYARREVPVSIEMVLKVAVQRGFLYELVKKNDEEGIWVYAFRFFTGTPHETETLKAGHKLRCGVLPK